jgi:hypothetical protein
VGEAEHHTYLRKTRAIAGKRVKKYLSGMSTEKKPRYYIVKKANRKPGRSVAKPNTDNNPRGGSNHISQKAIVHLHLNFE